MYQNEIEVTVRGYELDSMGHLNNAVYIQYVEAARWEFFKEMGFLTEGSRTTNGLGLVVIENTIRYIHELFLFDEVVIKTNYSCDGIYLVSKSTFIRKQDGIKVASATSKLVFVNETRQVFEIPDEIKKVLQ